jgi:long-chain fatty acid transport protein
MKRPLLSLLTLAASAQLMATNGYFDHGYGIKAKGMGGTGIAYAQDALAPTANPAGLTAVPDSLDLGLTLFRPDRGATNPFTGDYVDANGDAAFVIPNLAFKTTLAPKVAFGLPIFGNGGMNTTYAEPIFGGTPLTMNLEQAFVAPTLAVALDDSLSLGLSLIYCRQTFEATGLEGFGVTNAGSDTAHGFGARLGVTAKVNERLTLGATYQSEIRNDRFEKYSGLFAEGGDFDVPATYGVGAALKVAPATTVALDVTRILYSGVQSVGNPNNFDGTNLGEANGPGFGWRDVTVYKLGVSHQASRALTLRAGYNHNTQPIPSSQTTFNVIAPGVVRDHLTLGLTWKLANGIEISGFYAKALEETVRGDGTPTGASNLRMDQDSVGIGISWPL